MRDPIRRSTDTKPRRVGFRPQSLSSNSRPESAAPARKKAAEEMSPGTVSRKPGIRSAGPRTSLRSSTRSARSRARNRRSVWSRESTRPSRMVSPSPRSAARSRALLTWALGTGSTWRPALREPDPGRKHSGSSSPPRRPRMSPFILRSGSTTRSIGRPLSESSPLSTANSRCPASNPDSRRAVVPELPASSTSAGSRNPRRPRPSIRKATPGPPPPGSSRIATPSASRQARVDRQSPVCRGLRTRLSPVATEASSRARWVTDLSAGGARCPPSPEGAENLRIILRARCPEAPEAARSP